MKYKNFDEWFKNSKHRRTAGLLMKDDMMDAWKFNEFCKYIGDCKIKAIRED